MNLDLTGAVQGRGWTAYATAGREPPPRISVWTEVDANLQTEGRGGQSSVAVNETAVEAYRGLIASTLLAQLHLYL
jgi:hypothetical protein